MKNIVNELSTLIDKWYEIGVQLGVSESKLRQIEADHTTVGRRFSEVISFWLKGNTQVAMNWESLVIVLESSFVDEKGLAKKLREKGEMEIHDQTASPLSTGIHLCTNTSVPQSACGCFLIMWPLLLLHTV